VLDSGCRVMVGAFGSEAGDQYDVRSKLANECICQPCGKPSNDAPGIANGFSCREQITQSTGGSRSPGRSHRSGDANLLTSD
jgi:hypothetical protein